MRTVSKIEIVEEFPIYDITVENDHCFELANGVIVHNSLFPKAIVSGGSGIYYSANQIFIVGRSQEKDGTEITGWNFTLNIEKSRFVKEKSKLPIAVTYDGGINPFSGLLEWALESGHVTKPKNAWYNKGGDKNYREKDTNTVEFWSDIVSDESFKEFVKNKFMLVTKRGMSEDLEGDEDEV